MAKKKEELALAQLKTKQVLQEQQLQHKLSELQFEKDMLEAKMEEERLKRVLMCMKSLRIKSQYRDRLAEFIPEEPLHPHGNQAQNVAQSQLIDLLHVAQGLVTGGIHPPSWIKVHAAW